MTFDSIKALLREKGIGIVTDGYELKEKLGTVNQRTLRSAVSRGELKKLPSLNTGKTERSVYSLDEIAKWLSMHPRYLAKPRMKLESASNEEIFEWTRKIKIAAKNFTGLLRIMDIDDVVSECLVIIMKQRIGTECSESMMIHRALCKIWRKNKGQTAMTAVDNETLERMERMEEDD